MTTLAESTRLPKETTHAAAVQKREPGYIKQGKSDFVAGVKILEYHKPYLTVIRFDEKMSSNVTSVLRKAGFEWQADNKEWTRPIEFKTLKCAPEARPVGDGFIRVVAG